MARPPRACFGARARTACHHVRVLRSAPAREVSERLKAEISDAAASEQRAALGLGLALLGLCVCRSVG